DGFCFEPDAQIIGTPYKLVGPRPLGEGSFGQVWKAEAKTGQFVALKFCTNPDSLATLHNEKDKLKRIKNECGNVEGIVRLIDYDFLWLEGKWPPFLVFEYVEGITFQEYLNDHFDAKKAFSAAAAAEIIHDLAKIMAPVHSLKDPIAHR